jgi:hypothetical protein
MQNVWAWLVREILQTSSAAAPAAISTPETKSKKQRATASGGSSAREGV